MSKNLPVFGSQVPDKIYARLTSLFTTDRLHENTLQGLIKFIFIGLIVKQFSNIILPRPEH